MSVVLEFEKAHFERLTKTTLPYDQEGRAFAQREVQKGKPGEALAEFILRERKRLRLDQLLSPAKLAAALEPLSARVLCYTHHIVQEFLRRQENRFSFVELAENPHYANVIATSTASDNQAVINASGHMHYHVAAHRIAGKKTMQPSAGLSEQLRHTELRGLTADDLKLPYPSIYIVAPENTELVIWNDQSGWHKVVGIYLTEETKREPRSWRFLACGEPKPIEIAPGVYDDNDALIYFQVPLPQGMNLEDTLALTQEEVSKDVATLKKMKNDTFGPMLEKWQDIFRWAMNVVLYSSMEGAEVEEEIGNKEAKNILERMQALPKTSKKRRNLGNKLDRIQQRRRIVLGRHVTAQRGGWQLTVRVRVSGHWRNQPYGPGRMYRRLQWIEPFWRGPDVGAMEDSPSEREENDQPRSDE